MWPWRRAADVGDGGELNELADAYLRRRDRERAEARARAQQENEEWIITLLGRPAVRDALREALREPERT